MKILMYATGAPFTPPCTGGNKRFAELTAYMVKHLHAHLCCGDRTSLLQGIGLNATWHMKPRKNSRFLPPELMKLITNRDVVKGIRRAGYEKVVSFDVPATIGLALSMVKHVVLMIRKDMIDYELSVAKRKSVSLVLKLAYMWLAESICLLKAERIITQCVYDKEKLIKRHPLQKKRLSSKIAVQINNVNPTWVSTTTDYKDFPPNNRVGEKFCVCFVGNFDDNRKGHTLLLPVAKKLASVHDGLFFEIIGGGRHLNEYKTEYESRQIRFHGRLEDPIPVMRQCHLMVVPSLADSCPNTVMESLYWGIPVIGSRRGGIPEILEDEEALFDICETSLEKKISSLMNPKQLSDLQQRQAKRRKELTFDWAAKISELIQGV